MRFKTSKVRISITFFVSMQLLICSSFRFTWIEKDSLFDCIVGIVLDGKPVGMGIIYSNLSIITSLNPLNTKLRTELEGDKVGPYSPVQLTTSFDLRGVIHGDRMAGVPLGSSLGAGEVDVEGVCSQSGMACQNCSLAVTCIALPLGWLKVPLEECAEGHTCNAQLGGCSSKPVPDCDGGKEYQHSCEQVGIFPDARSCRKFHLCSPPQGLPDGRPATHGVALCPRNYGYNPQTAQCSIKLPHGQCDSTPVPSCNKVGDSGAVTSSLNHYYVCLMKQGSIQPQIFICPHGWYFWGGFCRPEAEPGSKNSSTNECSGSNSSETSSEEAKPETTTKKATEKPVYKVDSFFSTEISTTYAADTFLADKFDLSNYETVDEDLQDNLDRPALEVTSRFLLPWYL